jgi:transposase
MEWIAEGLTHLSLGVLIVLMTAHQAADLHYRIDRWSEQSAERLAKLRLITRRAFGFHSPHAAIAPAMLGLGGLCPSLPGW